MAMAVLASSPSLSHAAPVRCQTQDDLCLVVDSEIGAARGLEIDGENVLDKPGGLYVEDFAAGSETEPVSGQTMRKEDGSLIQKTTMDSLGLGLETTYQALDSCIRIHCRVRDLRKQDRAIALSYRLPVDAEGWTWGQNLAHSQQISLNPQDPAHQECFRNTVNLGVGVEGLIGRYPFSALSGVENGLSYAIRMDEPRVFLMQYRTDLRCYEIRFSLGLSQATEKFPGQADASFVIYRHDPRWGFRSAAQRYYDFFPEFFRVRVKRMGGWYCNTRNKALGAVPRAYDFNFAYHECSVRKPEGMRASSRLGIYTLHYTEPWFFHQLMPTKFFTDGKPTVAGGLGADHPREMLGQGHPHRALRTNC